MSNIWVRINGQRELRENLRTAIKDAGLSIAAVARKAEIKYSRLYPGLSENAWIPREIVEAVAKVLEVSTDELLGSSIYREDISRYPDFDHRPPEYQAEIDQRKKETADRNAEIAKGRERAICCTCGALRTYSTRGLYEYDERLGNDRIDGKVERRTREMKCLGGCGEETLHALLLPATDPHRDSAERCDQAPTHEDLARNELQALIDRVSGFGVDIHYQRRGKKLRAKGFTHGYEYDESKSRWRIELSPDAPARLNANMLAHIWKRISSGKHGDIDWDPKDGVVLSPSELDWTAATDELVGDLTRFLGVERRRMVAELNDQINAQQDPTDRDHDEESWA